MNKKRLLKLADYLDTVRLEKFDMNNWGIKEEFSCGTAACALGHAGTMKCFRKSGLKTEFDTLGGQVQFTAKNSRYASYFDIEAGEEFFGLNSYEAQYLFLPGTYGARKGPKTVAGRIRRLVRNNGIPKREAKELGLISDEE